MNKKRMSIKKELRSIAKSATKFDKGIYDYYLNNINNIGFTNREIGYLICDILYGFNYQKEDYELKIVDFLFQKYSITSHPRFNNLYYNSFSNPNIITFELMLRNNVIIEEKVVEFAEDFIDSIELGVYSDSIDDIENMKNRFTILQQYYRKQKIEKILSNKRTNNKMTNNLIINPLRLNKTT